MTSQNTVKCGWVQLNNTVVPHVKRHLANDSPIQLVPLPVIQHGAGLMRDKNVSGLVATQPECDALNRACIAAGLDFAFDQYVDLVPLSNVVKRHRNTTVSFLPDEDPFRSSEFICDINKSGIHRDNAMNQLGASLVKSRDTSSQNVSDDMDMVLDLSNGTTKPEKPTNNSQIQPHGEAVTKLAMETPDKTTDDETPLDLSLPCSAKIEVSLSIVFDILLYK